MKKLNEIKEKLKTIGNPILKKLKQITITIIIREFIKWILF